MADYPEKEREQHESQHQHEHHEHAHGNNEHAQKKKPNPWMVASALLAVAIVILVVYLVMVQLGPKGNGPIAPSSGKVLVEEFSDFQCPACGSAFPVVEQLREDYADKIDYVYRHFPLSQHRYAQKAAEASECARDQGKFEEYYSRLFQENIRTYNANEAEPKFSVADLKSYALQLGLDAQKFNSCLDSGAKASAVQKDVSEGTRRNLSMTPTFYINGKEIQGAVPLAQLKAEVDTQISSSSGSASGTDQNKAPDPEFSLVEIEDDSCAVCNQNRLPLLLTSSPFPSAKLLAHKASSVEGKKFIADHNLSVLPAFLLDKRAEGTANFSQLAPYLQKSGDYYIFPYELMDQISKQVGEIYAARRLLGASIPIENSPMLGNPNAKVRFVAFEDFQCPFCKKYEDETFPRLRENYIDANKVSYYFKDYQFLGPDSTTAGNAGQCAYEQGNGVFWQFHYMMYSRQGSENGGWASEASIKNYVKDLNALDQNKFNECLSARKYSDGVSSSLSLGQSLGVSGTPNLFINNIQVSGAYPFETFKQIIDDELEAQSKAAQAQ